MKKILSTLVMCLIFGVCSVYSATITLTAHAVVNDHSTSGGGEVVVHAQTKKASILDWDGEWKSGVQGVISSYTYEGNRNECSADLMTVYDGYYFYRWEKSDGTQLSAKNRPSNNAVSSVADHTVPTDEYHMYAVLKPVAVDNANNGTIYVTDIMPATTDGTVTFSVTGADNINDFYPPIVEGEGFAYKSMSYADNVVTVTVTYTVQDKDNVNGDDPKPNYSATVTLRSKGDADGTRAKQATITATESLIPTFTIPTDLDLTPNAPALTTEPAEQSFTITTTNQVAANATWSATLLQEAIELGFSVETSATTVTVKFTPKNNDYEGDLSATLSIKGSYTDSNGKIITNTQRVSLSADKGSAVKIDGTTTASYDFGTKEYTGQAYTQDLSYASNIATGITHSWVNGNFTHAISSGTITITLPATSIPGDYSDKLSVKYGDTEVASLTASAKVRLAQPQIESKVYMSQILLTWKNVYGAKQYILKSGETVIDISDVMTSEAIATASTSASHTISYSKMITAIGDVPLSTGTEYPFTLTVVYGDDVNNINDVTKISSTTITATPTATPTITAEDVPLLDIYTGTEIYQEGHATYGKFPYSPKRKIDLSAAFDASGNALFDELYIFGLTTSGEALVQNGKAGHKVLVPNRNADPTNVATTDAIVPCYIYKKINATTYGNLTVVANMNQKAKQIANIKANNQKVYFTGYCPIGSTGFTTGHYGVVCFEQDGEKTLDVYLDNLELHARSQTQGGAGIAKTLSTDTIQKELLKISDIDVSKIDIWNKTLDLNLVQYLESSAAAFAIAPTSTSTVFRPTIHLRGENRLNSASGLIKVTVELLGKSIPAGQYSSPLHIVTTNANHAAIVAIDDIWPKTNNTTEAALNSPVRTNGGLNLSSTIGGSPSIDLGNAKSGVQFNGGRVRLKNATPSSGSYTVTYAISCRSYNQSASVTKNFPLVGLVTVDADITLCGMGNDLPDGTVEFNDGTFYSEAISTSSFNTYRSFYHTRNCVKAPIKTTVNGGSYYCDIFAASGPKNPGASPKNRYGDGVVLDTIAIDSKTEPYQTANITFPNEKPVRDDFVSTYPLTLGAYYTAKGSTYNTNSMQAYEGLQQPDSVVLMIPYQYTDKELWEDIRVKNWVMCVPQMGLVTTIDGEETKMFIAGEDVAYVDSVVMDGLPVKTQYLLYAEYDPYIAEAVSSDYYLPDVGLGDENAVELQGDFIQSLKNKGDYQIQTAQYILKPVRGDEWMVFSPPFDVTNVYVLESYPEELLKEMDPYDALIQQAKANIDYLFYPAYYLYINDPAQNFWSFQNIWKANKKLTKGKGAIKLEHFTGKNYAKANYYLQHSSGEWEWDEANAKFKTDWEYLPTTPYKEIHGEGKNAKEYNVIMKKGELYSMNFPYMYQGYRDENVSGDPDFAGNWDYWTGKYIIFEGLGQQEIAGKNTHATISADKPQNVDAVLRGNATLSKINVAKNNAYYCNFGEGGQKFTGPYSSTYTEQLSPFSGFVLAGGQIREMPDRKASIDLMSGDVIFENDENGNQNNATGTPTIAGDNKMLVYTTPGAVGIVPVVAQQVCIYNAAGQVVTSQYLTSETQIPLPTGIYLVTGEQEQFKVMVK